MRKVTKAIVQAFLNNYEVKISNSFTDGQTLFLHGNKIAWKVEGGTVITNAGWKSNTTKERLNGLPGVSISQKAGIWYLNGQQWDGSPKLITN